MADGPLGKQIRARTLDEYIGQEKLKQRMRVYVQAALAERRQLDHMLLVAPPGSGKTTFAEIIADELGDPFHMFKMPVNPKELIYFIRDWDGGVLLLDELHSAPKALQEMLLPAIEDGYLQNSTGQITMINHITILGATTEPQGIIKPLWDRFLIKPTWDAYSDEELVEIIRGMAKRAGFEMPDGLAEGLGAAAGGTPRIAGTLVLAAKSLAVTGAELTVEAVLDLVGIDADGLTDRHVAYLRTVYELGGVSGLHNICSMLQLPQPVVEDLERLLITRGYVQLEPKGRTLTPKAMRKLPTHQRSSDPTARRTRPRSVA